MTEIMELAQERGMHYGHIAEELNIPRWKVRQAATTKKVDYKRIKSFLLNKPKVDVSIINKVMMKHDISLAEMSRRCGLHEERLTKIRLGKFILYRDIESKLKDML